MKTAFYYDSSDIDRRYDSGRRPAAATVTELVALLLRHAPGRVRRVLDLGCGTGRFSKLLAETFGSTVIGMDLAANMLAVASAKRLGNSIHFVRGSAVALPLDTDAVDVAFISQALHHLPDPSAAMAEVRRVLSIGGRLFVRQATRENLDSYFYQRFFPQARAIDEARLPSREQVISSARAAGLSLLAKPETVRVEFPSGREYVDKIAMRTNSDLAMISDEAFDKGMHAFAAYAEAHPDQVWAEEVDHIAFGVG